MSKSPANSKAKTDRQGFSSKGRIDTELDERKLPANKLKEEPEKNFQLRLKVTSKVDYSEFSVDEDFCADDSDDCFC